MEFPKLDVSVRSRSGKGIARRLRMKGLAPAVLYGKGMETMSLTVEPSSLVKALSGDLRMNTILTLSVANAAKGEDIPPHRRTDHPVATVVGEQLAQVLGVETK